MDLLLGQKMASNAASNISTSNEGHGTLQHILPTGHCQVRHYAFLCAIPLIATMIYMTILLPHHLNHWPVISTLL